MGRAREDGGAILAGGHQLDAGDLAHGHFVEPTVVRLEDESSALFVEEMFVPILLVASVRDLEEGLRITARIPGEPSLDAAVECVVLRYTDGPLFAFRGRRVRRHRVERQILLRRAGRLRALRIAVNNFWSHGFSASRGRICAAGCWACC